MQMKSMLTVPGYNISIAFQTPVRVIEPNPNWNPVVFARKSTITANFVIPPNPGI